MEDSRTFVYHNEEREVIETDLKFIEEDMIGVMVWLTRSETEDI